MIYIIIYIINMQVVTYLNLLKSALIIFLLMTDTHAAYKFNWLQATYLSLQ